MDDRIWAEIQQAKKNHFYCIFLGAYYRQVLMWFNIFIISLSGTGAMSWGIWKSKELAGIACSIIFVTTFLKEIQLYIIPSEKQIDKLDTVISFYFDYNNELENLWLNHSNNRITDSEAQSQFYTYKSKEKPISQTINEVVKRPSKKIAQRAEMETIKYLKQNFNC